jgi:hypothetical protein
MEIVSVLLVVVGGACLVAVVAEWLLRRKIAQLEKVNAEANARLKAKAAQLARLAQLKEEANARLAQLKAETNAKLEKANADAVLATCRLGDEQYFANPTAFRQMLETIDTVTDPVDFDALQTQITRRRADSDAPTERYFDMGELNASRKSRSERDSLTNNENDFSRFRRWMVADLPDSFVVEAWYPDDDVLESIVVRALFGNDRDRFHTFLTEMSRVRGMCLKVLNSKYVRETVTQRVFMMFADTMLQALSLHSLHIDAINRLQLCATLSMRTEVNGPTPVGVGAGGGESIRVVGELKANLRDPKAYAEKDQLLLEMEALYQRQPRGKRRSFVKGFVTDLFCLNMAVLRPATRGRDKAFLMAPRVWEHRAYVVRLMFLLCDPLTPQLWDSALQRSTVHVAVPRQRLPTTAKDAAAVVPAHPPTATKARSRRRNKKSASTTSQRSQQHPPEASTIWFKRGYDSDEYDEECEQLSRWWLPKSTIFECRNPGGDSRRWLRRNHGDLIAFLKVVDDPSVTFHLNVYCANVEVPTRVTAPWRGGQRLPKAIVECLNRSVGIAKTIEL